MKNYSVVDPFMRALFAGKTADNADTAILESAKDSGCFESGDNAILESAKNGTDGADIEAAMMEAVESRAQSDIRSLAASMLASWVEDATLKRIHLMRWQSQWLAWPTLTKTQN
ncbi:hypothetical protein ACMFCB_24590 [Escherichia coli]